MLQCVAVCFCVLQCVAVCCSVNTVVIERRVLAVSNFLHINRFRSHCALSRPSADVDHVEVLWRHAAMRWAYRYRCVAVCCSVLQCVAVCCRVLQSVEGCCSVYISMTLIMSRPSGVMQQCAGPICVGVLQCIAVCCSMLQCVAVCCIVLQCVYINDIDHV